MKEELRVHLEQQINENSAKGMSAEEARRSAIRAMGGLTQIEQQCRAARGGSVLQDSFRTCVTAFGNCALAQAFLPWQFCA
jgi:hypothetical protein